MTDIDIDALLSAGRESGAAPWLASLRAHGESCLREHGLPTPKSESWRYTKVERALVPAPRLSRGTSGSNLADVDGAVTLAGARRLVLVDGRLVSNASSPLDRGVVLTPFANVEGEQRALLEARLGIFGLVGADRAFASLNTAHLSEGVLLHVARGVEAPHPIHLIHVSSFGEEASVSHPRMLVLLEEGSRATVVESFVGAAPEQTATTLTNLVTEVHVGPNASFEHLRIVDQSSRGRHVASLDARVGRDGRYQAQLFCLAGELSRTEIKVELAEPGAEVELGGLYLAGDGEHADVQTTVTHSAPHGTSRELFKGVIGGRGTSAFNGLVLVREGAEKTDSTQYNKNLLLSRRATANTRPQLEIYADDVKCAHGATVGQLDEEQVFYLRSRGIGLEQARRELTYAFAAETVAAVPQGVRSSLERLVKARLSRAGASQEA